MKKLKAIYFRTKNAFSSRFCLLILMSSLMHSSGTEAVELQYPELLVIPRASERLKQEAEYEKSNRFFGRYVGMQLSGLTTLGAGVVQLTQAATTKQTEAGIGGLAVGSATIGFGIFAGLFYTPYASTFQDIQAMPKSTDREQIAREREAETTLENAASFGRKISWISFIANAGAGIYMVANIPSESVSVVTSPLAVAGAFLPLLFRSRWQSNYEEHSAYKKQIYGANDFSVTPVVFAGGTTGLLGRFTF